MQNIILNWHFKYAFLGKWNVYSNTEIPTEKNFLTGYVSVFIFLELWYIPLSIFVLKLSVIKQAPPHVELYYIKLYYLFHIINPDNLLMSQLLVRLSSGISRETFTPYYVGSCCCFGWKCVIFLSSNWDWAWGWESSSYLAQVCLQLFSGLFLVSLSLLRRTDGA